MRTRPAKAGEKEMLLLSVTGWSAIIVGVTLLIYLPSCNKIFFGQFWFEDTFEKELLNICLIFIGRMLLKIRYLQKKLNEVETREESSEQKGEPLQNSE